MQQNGNTGYLQIIKGAFSGLVSLVITVILLASIIYKNNINVKAYIPLILLSAAFSGFISGYISTKKLRKNGLVNGVISAIIPAAVLSISMSVANNGFSVFMMIPCVIMIIASAVGGILAVNTKRKIKKK